MLRAGLTFALWRDGLPMDISVIVFAGCYMVGYVESWLSKDNNMSDIPFSF